MKFPFSPLLVFVVAATLLIIQPVSAQLVEIPDPNLRQAIQETLELPPAADITQQQMLELTRLRAPRKDIADLTGLEHATNVESLGLWGNRISDLTPLANLTELKYLGLAGNQVVDITPLARLTQLMDLNLGWNRVKDISVLAKLINLKYLRLTANPINDYSPLNGLSLTELHRDYPCELPPLPIEPRLQNRTFPSVFSAWLFRLENRPELSDAESKAFHDLHISSQDFGFRSIAIDEGRRYTGNPAEGQAIRDELLSLNPNMLFLVSIRFRSASTDWYPADFPYWLRDENGEPIKEYMDSSFFTDFTQPGMQDIVVQQAIAMAKCGLFDGILLDWFTEHYVVLRGQGIDTPEGYYGLEIEQQAKDKILQRIRASVPDDFLIIANYNRGKIVRRASGMNGSYMETVRYPNGYTHDELKRIESALIWNDQNVRAPQVNCLEGWGITTEPPDSPNNRRFMRVFTTMSLTCSDGYVVYTIGDTHVHIWYDFWDANLGYPVGPTVQRYGDIEGLFIREFTNGWAVYNRSGKPQTITLPRSSTGVSSNKQDITHLLPDLDGEIYLRKGKPFDLNRDGTVNVLDLILVSQHFGTPQGDINGDNTTNILDLTLVAQQFSK